MIIAFIDHSPPESKKYKPVFRGKEVSFWLEKFFPTIAFFPAIKKNKTFKHLLVLHDEVFFRPIACAALADLTQFIEKSRPQENQLVAVTGLPFLIVAKSYLAKLPNFCQPGIYQRLAKSSAIKYVSKIPAVRTFSPMSEPLACEAIIKNYQIGQFQKNQIHISDLDNFYIAGGVKIGKGCSISTGVVITKDSQIGQQVTIYPHCYIENSKIGDHCVLLPGSIVIDSEIQDQVQLGPYCHLRMGTQIKTGAKVGNFVEMKKSSFGIESKAMHLSYIGDTTVGRRVNIGAGTITCNYDGKNKNPTFIEDEAFIGSGTELVAPVTIRRNSYVAAGSTITDEVPENSLGIARQKQRNIKGWVTRKRSKKKD